MKVISIDEDCVEVEVSSEEELRRIFDAEEISNSDVLDFNSAITIFVYIDPFWEEIRGKRALCWEYTKELAESEMNHSWMET
jgi:hypothetical protein